MNECSPKLNIYGDYHQRSQEIGDRYIVRTAYSHVCRDSTLPELKYSAFFFFPRWVTSYIFTNRLIFHRPFCKRPLQVPSTTTLHQSRQRHSLLLSFSSNASPWHLGH